MKNLSTKTNSITIYIIYLFKIKYKNEYCNSVVLGEFFVG